MNKKVMAIAVAGVLAAPTAFAQTSNVQLYGRAVLGVDNYEAEGARAQAASGANCGAAGQPACTVTGSQANYKSRFRVFDNSSRVGLRGTEDLGNGLKAIFQIETGVNIDNGSNTGQAGSNNASSGFWASRDSFVGLDSNWGRVTFGRQSIYWANGVNAQFAANYINTEIPWTNGTGFGRLGAPTARTNNVLQYTTPTFSGINGTISWSPGAGAADHTGANQEAVQNNISQDADGKVWGITLRGEWGPFYVQGDWANISGNDPSSTVFPGLKRLDVTGWKLGGSWGYMPGARIGVIWAMIDRNRVGSLGTSVAAQNDRVDIDGWTINWEHTFGHFQVMAQYGWTSDIESCSSAYVQTVSCNDSDSQGYMIGGRYFLSKRTWLFASYNKVTNGRNAWSDYIGGSQTSANSGPGSIVPYGADPQIWALGIFHQF